MNSQLQDTYRASVVKTLESWFEQHVKHLTIADAVHYTVFPGGKLIRSCFALSLIDDIGGDSETVLPAAAALELLHTSSLIHDDLPALDNDDMRRGRPSCHKRFDEATAILCGDFLIAAAFGLVAECSLKARNHELPTLFSEAFCHLCEGQLLDSVCPEASESLVKLHQLKTGALFRCAAGIAAQFVREDVYLVENIKQFGLWIGVAFQIADDLIDSNPLLKGRIRNSDEENRKQTFNDHSRVLQESTELTAARIRRYFTSIHDTVGKDLPRVREILESIPAADTLFRL